MTHHHRLQGLDHRLRASIQQPLPGSLRLLLGQPQRRNVRAIGLEALGGLQQIDGAAQPQRRRLQRFVDRQQQTALLQLQPQVGQILLLLLLMGGRAILDQQQAVGAAPLPEVVNHLLAEALDGHPGQRVPALSASYRQRPIGRPILLLGPDLPQLQPGLGPLQIGAQRLVGQVVEHHLLVVIEHRHRHGGGIQHRFEQPHLVF